MTKLRFSPEAQGLFNVWLSELEGRLRSSELRSTPAFESHLAKYRSLMPTLALLFHLVEVAGRRTIGPVSLPAAKLAADWCELLELHAQKVYAVELGGGLSAAHALASKIRQGQVSDGMTIREIYRRGWSNLKAAEQVTDGLGLLQQHGWLRVEASQGEGRPSRWIRINPLCREVPR